MQKYTRELEKVPDYHIIEQVIKVAKGKTLSKDDLEAVAKQLNLTPHRLEQVFMDFANVPLAKFFQFLQKDMFGRQLKKATMLTANISSEIGKPVMINKIDALEYNNLAKEIIITYGVCLTIFGSCFIAVSEQAVCYLAFTEDMQFALIELQKQWYRSRLVRDDEQIGSVAANIFPSNTAAAESLAVLVKGSDFQIKVWQSLLNIEVGKVVSYSDVAYSIGRPKAVRAVASAIANNNIAYIIPCHRVISKQGNIHQYRWGEARKKIMLGWEVAKLSQ